MCAAWFSNDATAVVRRVSHRPIRLSHGIPPPERSERAKLSPQERYEHEQRKLHAREQARPFIRAEVAEGLMGGIAELMYSEEIEFATAGVLDGAALKELTAAMAQFVAAEAQFDQVLQRQQKAEHGMAAAQAVRWSVSYVVCMRCLHLRVYEPVGV